MLGGSICCVSFSGSSYSIALYFDHGVDHKIRKGLFVLVHFHLYIATFKDVLNPDCISPLCLSWLGPDSQLWVKDSGRRCVTWG